MKILPRGNGVEVHDHSLILDSSIVELERAGSITSEDDMKYQSSIY